MESISGSVQDWSLSLLQPSKAEGDSPSCPFPGQCGRKPCVDPWAELPGLWLGCLAVQGKPGERSHLYKLRHHLPELGFRNIHLSENEWISFAPESCISPRCTPSLHAPSRAWLKGNVSECSGHAHSSILLLDEFHLQFTLSQTQQCSLPDQTLSEHEQAAAGSDHKAAQTECGNSRARRDRNGFFCTWWCPHP